MTAPAAAPAAALVARLADGDRGALARLLTLLEAGGTGTRSVLTALPPQAPGAAVVGITGAPGAGKSTLTSCLIAAFRARGRRVGVLAVDPTSPFSGGALLGDRIRMQDHEPDPDVYVRSMATRGQLGGLAGATPRFVRVLDAAGFDPVLVETVGVGQSEVAVAAAADTTVVVLTPGWGDSVQTSKAGLLEVGDVFVVNKADRPGAVGTVRDLDAMLAGAGAQGWRPPVLTTVAADATGVEEVAAAIEAHHAHLEASGTLGEHRERRIRDELRGLVLETLAQRADEVCGGPGFDSVVARVAAGSVDLYTASSDLLASER